MIVWNKALKGVCSRYDSMHLTMCNPTVVCDATLASEKKKKPRCGPAQVIKEPLLNEASTQC